MTTTSRWFDRTQPQMHPSILRVETRLNVDLAEPGTDLSTLAAGESVSLTPARPEQVYWTQDDRITFKNGAVLQERDDEGGLVLTLPSGEVRESSGWVEVDDACRVYVHGAEDTVWEQAMGPDGTRFEFDQGHAEEKLTARLGLDGQLSPGARRQGPVLVLQEAEALNPLVPLEWLISS